MKKIAVRSVLLTLGSVLLNVAGLAQTDTKATGHWQGKIQIPEHELGVTVDLARNAKGVWVGSMSVLGTSSIDVPLSKVAVEETRVRFSANLPQPASFDGRLSEDAAGLSGTASSAAGEAPFQLKRDGEANVKLPPPSSALSKEFDGSWEGNLDAGGKVNRIGLKLAPAADGSATATLIAFAQGNLEIPVVTVTIAGKDLKLDVRAVSGTYRGTLNASGEIAGEWAQGSAAYPLVFKRVAPKP